MRSGRNSKRVHKWGAKVQGVQWYKGKKHQIGIKISLEGLSIRIKNCESVGFIAFAPQPLYTFAPFIPLSRYTLKENMYAIMPTPQVIGNIEFDIKGLRDVFLLRD